MQLNLIFFILYNIIFLPTTIYANEMEYTPMGSKKIGNLNQNERLHIPNWEKDIIKIPLNYTEGEHHPDPFLNEDSIFLIDKNNYKNNMGLLTKGAIKLFETYNNYKMYIYKSHRTAYFSDEVHNAIIENGENAKLVNNSGVKNSKISIPFRFPKKAIEVMLNHKFHYRGRSVIEYSRDAIVVNEKQIIHPPLKTIISFLYSQPNFNENENIWAQFKQINEDENILLVNDVLDKTKSNNSVFNCDKGELCYQISGKGYDFDYNEAHYPGRENIRTNGQYDMFNDSGEGAFSSFNWSFDYYKEPQEKYIPYNSYKVHSDKLNYKDILTPFFVKPELLRYEIHRVWIINAELKTGKNHVYKKQTFYIDEDSWNIVAAEHYDKNNNLRYVSEAHGINYYEVPLYWTTLQVHMDLKNKIYHAEGLDNKEKMYCFNQNIDFSVFDRVKPEIYHDKCK